MISISKDELERVFEHSKEAYPHECCGVLLGKGKLVKGTRRLTNVNEERAADRYEIDPAELLKVEKEGRGEGKSVIGFYHSHPDHPSAPSGFDRERGFAYYSYIIVAVHKGEIESQRSWTFEEDGAEFEEEDITII